MSHNDPVSWKFCLISLTIGARNTINIETIVKLSGGLHYMLQEVTHVLSHIEINPVSTYLVTVRV